MAITVPWSVELAVLMSPSVVTVSSCGKESTHEEDSGVLRRPRCCIEPKLLS